jgi:hypothetical protein
MDSEYLPIRPTPSKIAKCQFVVNTFADFRSELLEVFEKEMPFCTNFRSSLA